MPPISLIIQLQTLGWPSPAINGIATRYVGFPIMWFGDHNLYFKSNLKVITVAINPSDVEFPSTINRFPAYNPSYHSHIDYLKALDQYFTIEPYISWFRVYENALHGLNATYGGKMCPNSYNADLQDTNTALHIDYDAPVATVPTWGNLSKMEQTAITNHYSSFFNNLIEYLNPDVILVSVATHKLNDIVRTLGLVWCKNLIKKGRVVAKIYLNKGKVLIAGQNRGTPMASLSNEEMAVVCAHAESLRNNNIKPLCDTISEGGNIDDKIGIKLSGYSRI